MDGWIDCFVFLSVCVVGVRWGGEAHGGLKEKEEEDVDGADQE